MTRAIPPRPRVLFIDHAADPGGGQLALLWLLGHTPGLRPEVAFLTDGPLRQRFETIGVPTHVVLPGRRFEPGLLVRAVPALRRLVRRTAPELIVVTSAAAAKAMALVPAPGRPVVVYLQEDLARIRGRGPITRVLLRGVYPTFDGIIANSRYTLATVPPTFAAVPQAVAYPASGLVRSGADGRVVAAEGEHPLPTGPRASATGPLRIAAFSRPERWKGLDLLLDALEVVHGEHPDALFRLDLYGGGRVADEAHRVELERRVAAAPYPARMHGHVEDVPARMCETDVLVLPSRLPEPFGQVVAQGLAHGCVVIVSDQGGAVEQVRHDVNGLAFVPGSVRSLADALESLLGPDGAALAHRLGTAAVRGGTGDEERGREFERVLRAMLAAQPVRGLGRRRLARRLRLAVAPVPAASGSRPHAHIVG